MSGPDEPRTQGTAATNGSVATNSSVANPEPARNGTAAAVPVGDASPLADGLGPDRVRHHRSGDLHTVVLDAGFAAATVRVVRTERPGAEPRYEFLKAADRPLGRSGWNYLPGDGTFDLGVIGAGDRWPTPGAAHGTLYAELGEQIREHLLGLIDAVATKGAAPPRERQPSLRSQWPAVTPDQIRGRSL